MEELIRLGTAPRPHTGADLEQRIREVILAAAHLPKAELKVTGWEKLAISADLSGADIQRLTIDASSLVATFTPAPYEGPSLSEIGEDGRLRAAKDATARVPEPEVLSREPAVLRWGLLRARPLRLQGVAIDIEAKAQDAPFDWVELADGYVALRLAQEQLPPDLRAAPPRVEAVLGIDRDDILTLVLSPMRADLEANGVRLSGEKLELKQLGRRGLRATARARIRWKLLAATFTVGAEVKVDDANTLHVSKPRLSTRNPFVAFVLAFFRGRMLREFEASMKPINLDEALFPWRLRDLRIRADKRVEVAAGAELA